MNGDDRGTRGALGWAGIVAGVLGVLAYLVGVPIPLALLLAAAAFGAGAALTVGGAVRDAPLPDPQLELRHGARREILQLSWNLRGRRGNRLDEPAVRRLRAVASDRLAARGIDLDDPADQAAAQAALGAFAYRVLSAPAAQPAGALLRCVPAIDRLNATAAEPRRSPSALRTTPGRTP